jgi:uncharacterized membrane protein YccC
MTLPGLYFGILIATTCGLAFYLVRGGGLPRLGLYVITAWAAFFVGHLVGEWLDWRLFRYGTLNLFPALFATLLGLAVATVLAGPERRRTRSPRERRRKP